MLLARALRAILVLFLTLAGVYFGLAGTLQDAQGWTALAVFFGCGGAITVWLWLHDRALLERRMKVGPGRERDAWQNVIQLLIGLVFLAAFALPGLDRRWGWSTVPGWVPLVGNWLMALGYWIVFLTFRANTFTAGTIEVAESHTVVDSGPYSAVRHPMYSGLVVLGAGIPLALGSWWGLLASALVVPVLVWRIGREEAFLVQHLPGYAAYRSRVPWRLAPGLW